MRRCLDCHTLTPHTRCPTCTTAHSRRRDRQRGSRQHRGYTADYARARAALLASASWPTPCGICGQPITTPADAHADHLVPGNLAGGLRITHAHCNIARANRDR